MRSDLEGFSGHPKAASHLRGIAVLEVAQDEDRAVASRYGGERAPHQDLELPAMHERLDARGVAGDHAVLERLRRTPPAGATAHQRGVHHDTMQPRGELRASAELVEMVDRMHVRILHGVPRLVFVASKRAATATIRV